VCVGIIPVSCWADNNLCETPSSSVIIPGDATIIGKQVFFNSCSDDVSYKTEYKLILYKQITITVG